jgi:hypothetical protein
MTDLVIVVVGRITSWLEGANSWRNMEDECQGRIANHSQIAAKQGDKAYCIHPVCLYVKSKHEAKD